MPVLTERRKFVRYMIPYEMLYVFDHYSARVGWVRDVGMGGLSFEFNHAGEADTNSEVIDVLAYDQERLYLPSVICEKTFSRSVGGRRCCNRHLHQTLCGQHFVSITAEQKNKWQEFIEKLSKYSDFFATVYDPFT